MSICHICGKKFTNYHALNAHMGYHYRKKDTWNGVTYPLSFKIEMIGIIDEMKKNGTVHWRSLVRTHMAKYHEMGCFDDVSVLRAKVRLIQKWFQDRKEIYLEWGNCGDNDKDSDMDTKMECNDVGNKENCQNNNDVPKKSPPELEHIYFCDKCGKGFDSLKSYGGHKSYHTQQNNPVKLDANYPVSFKIKMVKIIESRKRNNIPVGWTSLVREHFTKYHDPKLFIGNSNALKSRAKMLQRWYENKELYLDSSNVELESMNSNELNISDISSIKSVNNQNDSKNNMNRLLDDIIPLNDSISSKSSLNINLTCDICGKSGFKSKQALGGHKAYHARMANKLSSEFNDTNTSIFSYNDSNSFQFELIECQQFGCQQTFQYRSEYIIHLENHEKFQIISCPTCNQLFSSQKNLINHQKNSSFGT